MTTEGTGYRQMVLALCGLVMRNCESLARSSRLSESQQWKSGHVCGWAGDWRLIVAAAKFRRYLNVQERQVCYILRSGPWPGNPQTLRMWDRNVCTRLLRILALQDAPNHRARRQCGIIRSGERLTFCLTLLLPGAMGCVCEQGRPLVVSIRIGWRSAMSHFGQVHWLSPAQAGCFLPKQVVLCVDEKCIWLLELM